MEEFSKSDIKKLKVARFLCQESLLFHTRYFFKHNHKRKFVLNKHHEIIANALEKVLTGDITRLIINIAPRYGKTEIAVKNFASHGIAVNPSAKFIHLSYSDTLALDNSEEIKDMIESDSYQELFPEIKIKKDSKSKKKWYTKQGGGVYATAAGGQVTGFGAGNVDEEDSELQSEVDSLIESINDIQLTKIEKKQKFGGAIIIDDPIKPDDADSDVVRERINQRFDSTIRNRTNSRNTPIIIVMQRLHPNDLAGYVQAKEPGVWTVISLPCLSVNAEGKLEALWEFKHTIQELHNLRKLNELVFDRQYQQDPKPKEGLLFYEKELNYYNPKTIDVEKLAEYKHMQIDPANEGGDDLAAPIGYLIGNKIYIIDIIYNNHGTDVNEPAVIQKEADYKLDSIEIEGNSAWYLFANNVADKLSAKRSRCYVRTIKNTTNKHTRIFAQSAFIKSNFVFRDDWNELPQYKKFMQVLTSYTKNNPGTQKDDAPDAAAGMAAYFARNFGHLY